MTHFVWFMGPIVFLMFLGIPQGLILLAPWLIKGFFQKSLYEILFQGFLSGLIVDCLSSDCFGIAIFSYMLGGYLLFAFKHVILEERIWTPFILGVILSFIFSLITMWFATLSWGHFFMYLLLNGLYCLSTSLHKLYKKPLQRGIYSSSRK